MKRSQLLLRWPHNAAQVELSLSRGGPLFNVLLLSNLEKYDHKSYIAENQILRVTFHRIQYGSNFHHFDIVGPQFYKIR